MKYKDNQYIVPESLYWKGVLHNIPKSRSALQPIFEAFTNAIEAIKIKQQSQASYKGQISIKIKATETTIPDSFNFASLSITDDGIGFDNEQFKRFNTYRDITKGFKNLGSGRIQFVHYFDSTTITSVFKQDEKYFKREFSVSKKKVFLDKNSIVLHKYCKETTLAETQTTITFSNLLENSGIYNKLDGNELKEQLKKRYIHYFCHNRKNMPLIDIQFFVQGKLKSEITITETDFPNIDKTETLRLKYSKVAKNGTSIEKSDRTEDFKIDAFCISSHLIDNNDLKLVSKGEIVEDSEIKLESIPKGEHIKGYKYIFLVSSEYIDDRDTDMRGVLNIPSLENFTKNRNLFTEEEILIEEIQEGVNNRINTMYPEIEEVKREHVEQFEKLKEMFLLDDETASSINISINDSEGKILEKFYEAEAKKVANCDAKIKEIIDGLEKLDTTTDKYSELLEERIVRLVKEIPLQNKVTLTQYVARRKLVLELFNLINNKKLATQLNDDRNKDEKLLHNLIFQQTNSNAEDSDLWLINEDFIYFKGVSEKFLKDIELDGVKLLRENLTDEEEKFRVSLNENRFSKRPDILLFPDEGKCLIIEFKNPDVNVSSHLSQINNYASLIWNFSSPQFQFNTFYGYLIGEKVNSFDVRSHDGDFKEAYQFDYLFRNQKVIPGLFVKGDASLYTEVIKYSTLYERAKRRNNIFIKKLGRCK